MGSLRAYWKISLRQPGAVGAEGDRAYAKAFEVDSAENADLFVPFYPNKAHKGMWLISWEG
jgi:hypothetical protein